MIKKYCEVCGELIWDNKRFCSRECKNEFQRKEKIEKTCEICGAMFEVPPCRRDARFCSSGCKDEWHSKKQKDRIWIKCEICGKEFEITPSSIDKRRTCSSECSNKLRSKEQSGSKNSHWQGGEDRYYGPNWPGKRKETLERDNFECQICGTNQYLTVHHIKPIKKFNKNEVITKGNSLNNLVTLCRSCHSREERNNGN